MLKNTSILLVAMLFAILSLNQYVYAQYGEGDETEVEVRTRDYDDESGAFQPWSGFGIHGGVLSDYKNLTLEESIDDAFGDVEDFSFEGEMTDIGAHVDFNSMRLLGFGMSFDYAWRTRDLPAGVELRHSVVALTGDVKLVVPFVISPFVGIGLGGFYTAQSIEGQGVEVVVLPDDRLNFGWLVNGGLGLDVPEFPLRPFVEWRYNNVRTEGDPVQYHALLAGVTLKILQTR